MNHSDLSESSVLNAFFFSMLSTFFGSIAAAKNKALDKMFNPFAMRNLLNGLDDGASIDCNFDWTIFNVIS
jgi:hypothetical protein